MNSDLDDLTNWFKANRLALNVNKSNCMLFQPNGNQNTLGNTLNIGVDYYFADTGVGTFRGRPRTTLPTALSADLRRVGRTLRRPADIDALRLLNREQWRQLERDIAEES